MAEHTPPAGVVPPYLGAQWVKMRGHLSSAALLSADAAGKNTLEELRPLLAQALIDLIDANFWAMHLERDYMNEPLDGVP